MILCVCRCATSGAGCHESINQEEGMSDAERAIRAELQAVRVALGTIVGSKGRKVEIHTLKTEYRALKAKLAELLEAESVMCVQCEEQGPRRGW